MDKKYLITGYTGFIGQHLGALLLEQGHSVYGLSREGGVVDGIIGIGGDLRDKELIFNLIKNHEFDGIFHLAAQTNPPISFKDPIETFQTNTLGTINLAEGIKAGAPSTRLMFASTGEVYGVVGSDRGPITEDFPLQPVNPYGVSKAAAELYLQERVRSSQIVGNPLSFFISRGFSHTGPGRKSNFAVASDAYQIAKIRAGIQEPVIRVGNLAAKRTFVDVRDSARAMYLLMQNASPGEIYNIGGNNLYSIGELLDMMLDISGLKSKVILEKDPKLFRPVDIPVQIPDSSKLRTKIGWSPQISITKTLEDLLSYCDREVSVK
jgi:nucleoside-diphosphate-sugar epimerase